MTAYLQPGDKIHITVPGDFSSPTRGQKKLESIVAAYKALGIEVFAATPVSHSEQVTIVAMIRVTSPPRYPRSAEKLKLVDDSPLPWQGGLDLEPDLPEATEPPRLHPGYQDHPRVP